MVHAYQRRPKPLSRSETERIQNFLDIVPAPGVTAPINATCRQLRDQGISREELAHALFAMGAAYLHACGIPLEAEFSVTTKRVLEE